MHPDSELIRRSHGPLRIAGKPDSQGSSLLGGCDIQIGISHGHGVSLAAKLHQHGHDVFRGLHRNDAANLGAVSKGNLLDRRVADERVGHFCRVLLLMEDEIEATRRQASLAEDVRNGPVAL